nr:hypothetical protein GCM10020092_027630 [Actinoplanes digitatis]
MTMTAPRVGITQVASFLPEQQVTTADLQRRVTVASGLPLPDGMFAQTTGIETRRVAADDEYASDLAIGAGWLVLEQAEPGRARRRPAAVRLGDAGHDRTGDRARRPGGAGRPGARARRDERLQQLPQRHRPGPLDDPG